MTIRVGYFVWVERATRRWQPKAKGFRAGTAFFVEEGWFNGHELPV